MRRAGYKSAPMATMVTALPPVRVVKNALAKMHTMARPPGIQPIHLRAASKMALVNPASTVHATTLI